MKLPSYSLLLATTVSSWTPTVLSFAPPSSLHSHRATFLDSQTKRCLFTKNENSHKEQQKHEHEPLDINIKSMEKSVKGVFAATCLAGAIWASPAAIVGGMLFGGTDGGISIGTTNDHHNTYLSSVSASSSFSSFSSYLDDIRTSVVVQAKEMASASGSRVNKDPESLLRYGLPIPKDKEVRKEGFMFVCVY